MLTNGSEVRHEGECPCFRHSKLLTSVLGTSTVRLQHKMKTEVGISTGPNAALLYSDEFQDETVALLVTTGIQAKSIY